MGVGAGLLTGKAADGEVGFVVLLVLTGVAMAALDFWANPRYLDQWAGLAVLVKLGFLGAYLLASSQRHWLFWVILAISTLAAHAPARLRHRSPFMAKGDKRRSGSRK